MEQVNKYINSVYRHVGGNKEEIKILKEEMRNHLIQMIEELKAEGKSDEESISLAIKMFGEENQIEGELINVFKFVNKKARKALIIAVSFLIIAIISFSVFMIATKFSIRKYTERNTEIFNVMSSYSKENTYAIDKNISRVVNESKGKITWVAMFRVTNGEDEWYRNSKDLEYVYPKGIKVNDLNKGSYRIKQIILKDGTKFNVNIGLIRNTHTSMYIQNIGRSTFIWLGCFLGSIIVWILLKISYHDNFNN